MLRDGGPPRTEFEQRSNPSFELVQGIGRAGLTPNLLDNTTPEATSDPNVHEVYRKRYDFNEEYRSGTCEVFVESDLTLEDYEAVTPPEDWERLTQLSEELRGKRVSFYNATPKGGGVAIMRGPLVHLLRLQGVDAHWYALSPDPEAAKVTKWKFHNVMQAVAEDGVRLTEENKAVYNSWMKENYNLLAESLSQDDIIIMDDWQPSGLIPYIKGDENNAGLNRAAPILFRDHIHTEGELMVTPGTPQHTTWDFLWNHNRIKDADVFITHPKDEFVPPNVPDEKVVFMPATGDLLDDLNRGLTNAEEQSGRDFINNQLAQNENQLPIDPNRPYIVLIARFDESKGMPQGIESYAKARRKLIERGIDEQNIPQFVVLGNGSVDDPSGTIVLEDIMRLRSEQYDDIKDDLKVARVPHNDVAINALLKGAKLALQPSTKEGFESRVTDAILQLVPVIGSDRGGIPLQIKEGQSGYVINPYDTDQWAERIVELMSDSSKYQTMVENTGRLAKTFNYEFTTVPNAINWLFLAKTFLNGGGFAGNREWVRDRLIREEDNEQSLAA
jgi:alpha,alpha-trehalose phosphorylase (configuration-retaining)